MEILKGILKMIRIIFLSLFLIGCTNNTYVTAEMFRQASIVCEKNGGIGIVHSYDHSGYFAIVCSNGARFDLSKEYKVFGADK